MNTMSSLTLTFKAQSFRKIPNPYLKKEEGDKKAEMYMAICDVKDLPDNFPMETNPREQKLTTFVAKKIKDSLLGNELNFFLLNRGILLSAKGVSFNNYSNEITISFEDTDVHGNVDGGHTYKTILMYRDQIERDQQYVKIEILTGIEDIFESLASARNTSVQVQDKSIAELEDRFDIIKNALSGEKFFSRIFYKENSNSIEKDIDVADILAILNMFNIDKFSGKNSFPIISYSGKKKCIDYYIDYHRRFSNTSDNPYVKMSNIMPDFFKLYEEIERNMSRFYKVRVPNGRYGSVKGVQLPKSGQHFFSKFMHSDLDMISPNGFIYPILGSFRALLKEEDGEYVWMHDPFDILEKTGPELVETTISMSRDLGNNPQSTGKNSNLWTNLYKSVALELLSGN